MGGGANRWLREDGGGPRNPMAGNSGSYDGNNSIPNNQGSNGAANNNNAQSGNHGVQGGPANHSIMIATNHSQALNMGAINMISNAGIGCFDAGIGGPRVNTLPINDSQQLLVTPGC